MTLYLIVQGAVRSLEQVCGKIIGQISKYTMLKQLPGTPEGSNRHVEIREEFASPHAGNVAGNQSSPVYSSRGASLCN